MVCLASSNNGSSHDGDEARWRQASAAVARGLEEGFDGGERGVGSRSSQGGGGVGQWARGRPCRRESTADAGVPPRARPAAQQGARVIVEQGATSARLSDAKGARIGSRRARQCGVST